MASPTFRALGQYWQCAVTPSTKGNDPVISCQRRGNSCALLGSRYSTRLSVLRVDSCVGLGGSRFETSVAYFFGRQESRRSSRIVVGLNCQRRRHQIMALQGRRIAHTGCDPRLSRTRPSGGECGAGRASFAPSSKYHGS